MFYVKEFNELSVCELYEILKSRFEIFACEQKITCENEIDGKDYFAKHAFIIKDNKVVAYLRFFISEKNIVIGRVLSLYHNQGLGTALMKNTISYIKANYNYDKIMLNSQKQAIDFYKKLGFKIVSKEFLEANIPHYRMEL